MNPSRAASRTLACDQAALPRLVCSWRRRGVDVARSTEATRPRQFPDKLRETWSVARQYWWFVLIVAVLALVGAVLSTARTPVTYVARTALIVASNDRPPNQDAVLVKGYVAYFNDKLYQEQLVARAVLDPGVTAQAQALAQSPIMVISASGRDAQQARVAAVAVARTFRDDINQVHLTRTEAELAALNDQLEKAPPPGSTADRAALASLRNRIYQLEDDRVDVLQVLQLDGGVAVHLSPWLGNVAVGLFGGVLTGALAASALARVSGRLRTAYDVETKVALRTLVELPGPRARGAAPLHQRRLRQLANHARTRLGGSGVVLVTSPGEEGAARMVAGGLASEWAAQGYSTVLVRFSHGTESSSGNGNNRARQPASASGVAGSDCSARMPGDACQPLEVDVESSLSAEGLAGLLKQEPLPRSLVVLEAPGALRSSVPQTAGLVANATLLVLDPRQTGAAEASEAVDMIDQPGVPLLGAVLASQVADSGSVQSSISNVSRRSIRAARTAPASPGGGRWSTLALGAGVLGGICFLFAGLTLAAPDRFGLLVVLTAVAALGVVLGLSHPVLASGYLLLSTFFRLAIPSGTLPVDPFLLAFAGVIAATAVRTIPRWRRPARLRINYLVLAIALYIAWNVVSMVLPHTYPAGAPSDPAPFSVSRFVLIGVVMPMCMFLVGRWIFASERGVRVLLWSLTGAAAYSSLVSILQFTVPALVWPRYILENTFWPGRAVGVFNQPVVNGLVLIVGFSVATLLMSHPEEPSLLRAVAAAVALASAYGVYLTHTRVVWLAFVLVVVLGAVIAHRFRRGFLVTLAATVLAVALNWSTFTSSDRSAGGVGSVDEVQDRLNTIATSGWAFLQRPVTGWGIGRFAAVNTYHHQQWSPEIPWERGYGIPSHLDALGVLVELGIVGLVLWLAVQVLIYRDLLRATRALPEGTMYGRPLALTALLCLVAQTISGLTVDLRFFDFPNIVVMLLAGAAIGLQQTRTQPAAVEARVMAVPVPFLPKRAPVLSART